MIEIKEKIPIMTYSQYRRARKLVHQCCNYESGNCLALDDGEPCPGIPNTENPNTDG